MICKSLQVLPSDPNFIKMTPTQIYWCFYNILEDAKIQKKALEGKESEFSVEMDNGNFDEMVKQEFKEK